MNSIFIQQPIFSAIMNGQCNRVRVPIDNQSIKHFTEDGGPETDVWIYNEKAAGLAKIISATIEHTPDRRGFRWALDIEA